MDDTIHLLARGTSRGFAYEMVELEPRQVTVATQAHPAYELRGEEMPVLDHTYTCWIPRLVWIHTGGVDGLSYVAVHRPDNSCRIFPWPHINATSQICGTQTHRRLPGNDILTRINEYFASPFQYFWSNGWSPVGYPQLWVSRSWYTSKFETFETVERFFAAWEQLSLDKVLALPYDPFATSPEHMLARIMRY